MPPTKLHGFDSTQTVPSTPWSEALGALTTTFFATDHDDRTDCAEDALHLILRYLEETTSCPEDEVAALTALLTEAIVALAAQPAQPAQPAH